MQAHYLTAGQIRSRFGGISDMTLWRWLRNDDLGFPQPTVINGRRYFALASVEAFERRRDSAAASKANSAGATAVKL